MVRRGLLLALALTTTVVSVVFFLRADESAAESPVSNLLANGSFERSLGGWKAWNAVAGRVQRAAVGRRAARVRLRGAATDYSLYPSPRPVAATVDGAMYTARAWLRSARPGRTVCLRIREWQSGDTESGSAQACQRSTRKWRRFPLVRYTAIASGHSLDVYAYQAASRRGDTFDVDGIVLLRRNASPPPVATGPVLLAAGDIASCLSRGDEATAALLDRLGGTVVTLGDNVYEDATQRDFAECYHPSWGRHKGRTRPSAGNHDYHTSGASAYFDYFGAAAGQRGKGYYSYNVGTWHVIALNSNCADVGGCAAGSPQERWLRADLSAHDARCTVAYWHHPRFSSGDHGDDRRFQAFWQALYDHNADVVLVGHDHNYERFAPQTPGGAADPRRGLREFVVGTGGRSLRSFPKVRPNSQVKSNTTFGVLRLALDVGKYSWRFVPQSGKAFTDSGSDECH